MNTANGTRLRFTKMHGLGNDFVVLDGINQAVALTPAQAGDLGELLWEVAGLEERTNGSAGEFKVRLADGMFEVLTRHPDGFEPADPHGVRQVKRYG
mgnify:CR=1 FL=1